jgi:hypothetical protein
MIILVNVAIVNLIKIQLVKFIDKKRGAFAPLKVCGLKPSYIAPLLIRRGFDHIRLFTITRR